MFIKILNNVNPKLQEGCVYEARPYTLESEAKLTVLDHGKEICNVYRSEVKVISYNDLTVNSFAEVAERERILMAQVHDLDKVIKAKDRLLKGIYLAANAYLTNHEQQRLTLDDRGRLLRWIDKFKKYFETK